MDPDFMEVFSRPVTTEKWVPGEKELRPNPFLHRDRLHQALCIPWEAAFHVQSWEKRDNLSKFYLYWVKKNKNGIKSFVNNPEQYVYGFDKLIHIVLINSGKMWYFLFTGTISKDKQNQYLQAAVKCAMPIIRPIKMIQQTKIFYTHREKCSTLWKFLLANNWVKVHKARTNSVVCIIKGFKKANSK